MSKFTTTLYEYLASELQLAGHNEFRNNGRLTFFDDEYAFMQKVLMYDEDVQKIVDNKIFKGIKFSDEQIDKDFKTDFVTRFMDREFSRQTVEAFASQVVHVTFSHIEYIEMVYGQLKEYAQGTQRNKSEDEETQTSTYEHRQAKATLPQTEVNVNVDNDELDFADENMISKDKNEQKGNKKHEDESHTFNPEFLKQIYDMKTQLMNEFDKKCFMQIW